MKFVTTIILSAIRFSLYYYVFINVDLFDSFHRKQIFFQIFITLNVYHIDKPFEFE